MKQVTILGLHNTTSSIICGPLDVFYYAGRLWNGLFNEPVTPYFDVEIVSYNGEPIRCEGNLMIQPHRSITSVEDTDLLIIPSIHNLEETMTREKAVFPWIKKKRGETLSISYASHDTSCLDYSRAYLGRVGSQTTFFCRSL